LRTRFINYQYVDTFTGELHNLDGRAQAHAPGYQFSLSADWHHPSGWMARVDLTGKGSFYFETSSNQASAAYQLLNARFGYEQQRWSAYLWARNLLNRSYAVRGFFFGNEPPDFSNKLYLQHGDPRQFGLSLRYQLSQR
jgi:outer membrane receptor protein involved in Fe transport